MRRDGGEDWPGLPRRFEAKGWTPVPDLLFDRLLPNCDPRYWRVVSYLVRQTYGWGREEEGVARSIRQIARALSMRVASVAEALKALEARGVIVVERTQRQDGSPEVNRYRFRWEDE